MQHLAITAKGDHDIAFSLIMLAITIDQRLASGFGIGAFGCGKMEFHRATPDRDA